ncbi:MAG: hypothetical protein ACOVSW_04050 [Candidatus Kapaibacteriota bacterium]|jgi:hypothetical protein
MNTIQIDIVRIHLSALWIALMLTNLFGDVLRLMTGDVARMGETQNFTQVQWLFIAVLMSIQIFMVYLSLVLSQPLSRWTNIIIAGLFFVMNISSIHTYPSMYDRYLLGVGLIFNVLTIWSAWNWKGQAV